jgi:hypothetical protein
MGQFLAQRRKKGKLFIFYIYLPYTVRDYGRQDLSTKKNQLSVMPQIFGREKIYLQ